MKVCFLLCAVLWLLLSVAAKAQTCNDRVIPSTPDSRFSVSGDEVTDLQTGLIWQRCSVGQRWDGTTCSGRATTHNWSEALAMASGDWRLPNIKELTSIVEMACYNQSINLTVFPVTVSSGGYWSSSLFAQFGFYAWSVNFAAGREGTDHQNTNSYVRLVRDAE